MNLFKTKAMWVGKNKNSLETPLGLEWCTGVKTLGIHFSCDQEQVMKQNFQDRKDLIIVTLPNRERLLSFHKLIVF
jgi:hypothetical protein